MNEADLKKITTESLIKKAKATKTLIGIFIPLIVGLFYFSLRDYFWGKELDMPIFTIAICTVGGMISFFPELKAIQKELKARGH